MARFLFLIGLVGLFVGLGMVAFARPSLVEIFNALMLHDRGASRAAEAVSYGPAAQQALDVYVPDDAPENAPVLVHFYGGGWNSGTRKGYGFLGKAFASRGIITVIPDYRPHPEGRYPGFLEDSAAAVAWVQEQHRVVRRRSVAYLFVGPFRRGLQCGDAGAGPALA
jgi:acetyl esterase/lipase